MLAAAAVGLSLVLQPAFDFRTFGPYDRSVPTPESILGYAPGAKHSVYADQEKVVLGITQAAKSRTRVFEYGKSTQGRTLRIVAISSPENIANLEAIRRNQLALANPSPGQDTSAMRKKAPTIVWINQCIHGDETASFESGMELMYALASSKSKSITSILENTVVIVNPVYNPDGHERYVVAYNSIPNGNPEDGTYDTSIPSAFFGRSNHYRFDMNRDRIALSQAETRQEVAMFLNWNPHVYADQHGQVETYFFPPVQQSVNINADRERYNKWTEIFGRATGKAFDAQGWTYYVRDQFDFYNICYLDTHATLMGAIGMTHETDGGRLMVSKRRDDTLLTLRDGMAKHFISALAVIESASQNRENLLNSYSNYKEKAVSGKHAGSFQRVVMTSESQGDLARLQAHLSRTGIQSKWVGETFELAGAKDYWSDKMETIKVPAGALVVDLAQSQGPLAKALLEPGSDFEPEFVARQKAKAKSDKEGKRDPELDSFEFYDSTAWALPYAYNVKAWWSSATPAFREGELPKNQVKPATSSVGWYLDYKDQEDILFVAKALGEGFKAAFTTKPMLVAGVNHPAGTFLFLAARNEEGFGSKLSELAQSHGVQLKPLATSFPDSGRQGPGSESVVPLKKPKIGIIFGNSGSLGGGALWYLMEKEFRLPFYGLTASSVARVANDYTCLIFPDGARGASMDKIKEYIQGGGCAISLGDSEMFLGKGKTEELEARSADTSLPGAMFLAEVDPLSFLGFGYANKKIAVPIEGSQFFVTPKGGSAVALSADEKVKKLLSGWTWDETEKDLRQTVWLHESGLGRGRAITFAQDPTYRAQLPGLYKLLLNAMILGPS